MAKKKKPGESEVVKNLGGRPAKLTPQVKEQILAVLKMDGYVETACAFVGISREGFYEWMRRGAREDSGIYKDFAEAVNKATAEGEIRGVSNIQKAANGYDVLKTRTVTEQRPAKGEDGKTSIVTVTSTTEEKSREFAWQAQAWLLERRFPNRWARRDFVEMSGDQEKPIQIKAEVDVYSPAYMAKLIAAFADVQLIAP